MKRSVAATPNVPALAVAKAPAPDFSTPPQIAERLQVKASRVVGWIRRGELVGIDVAERGSKRPRWRVAHDDLQAFLALRSTHQKPAAPVVRRRRVQAPFVDYFPTKKVLVAK